MQKTAKKWLGDSRTYLEVNDRIAFKTFDYVTRYPFNRFL